MEKKFVIRDRKVDMRKLIGLIVATIVVSVVPLVTLAADFPKDKPVTIVVPFSAGGPTDKVVRALALVMGKHLGQMVIVDNAAGAGGTLGTRKVAVAPKDGYTVLVHTMGMSTASSLYRNLSFNALKDFEYVGQVVDVPMVLLGSKAFAPQDFVEAQQYIRANSGKVSIGHAGPGSAAHLCTLLLEREVKAAMVSVAYKGSAPALSDVMGGQIDMVCDQTTSLVGQLDSGTVKPLAITTLKRVHPFNNLPTADEQGLKGFDMRTWHGMYAPKGVPPAALSMLVGALQAAVQDPGFQKKMTDMGGQVVSAADATPESLKAKLTSESTRWARVIQDAGIKPN